MTAQTITNILAGGFLGVGFTCAGLAAFGKNLIDKAIDAKLRKDEIGYQHTFDTKLAVIQSQLSTIASNQEITFSRWHEKQMESVSILYEQLVVINAQFENAYTFKKYAGMSDTLKEKFDNDAKERLEDVQRRIEVATLSAAKAKLYIGKSIKEEVDTVLRLILSARMMMHNYKPGETAFFVYEDENLSFSEYAKHVRADIAKAIEGLEAAFTGLVNENKTGSLL